MGRDYRKESWWPQPLLDGWYLTDCDSFEISTKSVGEAEKNWPQKLDSLGSRAWLNPGISFHVTKFKCCTGKTGSCSGLVWLCF